MFDVILACGGSGKRMRASGLHLSGSKSMIKVTGSASAQITILALKNFPVRRIIIASDDAQLVRRFVEFAKEAVDCDVIGFVDAGLGVHGLPCQVAHLILSSRFFLIPGHCMLPGTVYHQMSLIPKAFVSLGHDAVAVPIDRPRQTTPSWGSGLCHIEGPSNRLIYLSMPYLLDKSYFRQAETCKYECRQILLNSASRGQHGALMSQFPVEADVLQEWQDASLAARGSLIASVACSREVAVHSNLERS